MSLSNCVFVPASIADVLRGRRLLIIGGDAAPAACARLHAAFDLLEVVHCPTSRHDASARRFARRLADRDWVLVIWVAGLSRTGHGTVVHEICRGREIPFLDCMRAPHPNALVNHLLRLHLVSALERRTGRIPSAASACGAVIRGIA